MARTKVTYSEPVIAHSLHSGGANESSKSAVAWAAIIGGALTTIVVSLTLFFFGAALGLGTVSPWRGEGLSVTGFTVLAAIWLIVMQWLSAALGGYLTGRLRTKFVRMHDDEVFFRDTAHGFLSWSLATIITVFLLASSLGHLAAGGAKMAGGVAAGGAMGAAHGAMAEEHGRPGMGEPEGGPFAYNIDTMFRSGNPNPNATSDSRAETTRILVNDLKNGGEVSAEDEDYLSQQVAARAGISQDEAKQRVDNTIQAIKEGEAKAKQAANDARKASAKMALFTFISMVIGAFISSVAAALGGRQRDELHALANS